MSLCEMSFHLLNTLNEHFCHTLRLLGILDNVFYSFYIYICHSSFIFLASIAVTCKLHPMPTCEPGGSYVSTLAEGVTGYLGMSQCPYHPAPMPSHAAGTLGTGCGWPLLSVLVLRGRPRRQ